MDDRITTLISSLPPRAAYFSLEFFPPKTQAGFTNLQSRLARMALALRPLFVTVTYGAGGSTGDKSLELAEVCQRQLGLPTVLHLTCTNMRKRILDETLETAKEIGIRNILALRGDPPREEYKEEDEKADASRNGAEENEEPFVWAVDLVKYIRRVHGDYFCVGVAGYPEGHADESNPAEGSQSVEHDLPYLAEKVAAGADFIMTQLSYDIDAYAVYEQKVRHYEDKDGRKLFERIPIIPGLMPIQSYQIIKRITKLSHAKIPADLARRIDAVKNDDEAVKSVGVEILSDLVEGIKKLPQPEGVRRGFHFYTLNLERTVAFVLERTNLIPPISEPSPEESSDSDVIVDDDTLKSANGAGQYSSTPRFSRRRASSVNAQPHNRVIMDRPSRSPQQPRKPPGAEPSSPVIARHEAPDRGTGIPASDPTRKHNLMISEGQGSLGREATWDDFPNGRWGPSQSPAFGEIDGYGPNLKVGPVTARKLWGHPRSAQDVTELFRRHVLGQLEAVPWSDEVDVEGTSGGDTGALRAETDVIRKELIELIEKKGYWTLASQPAVDGVRSDDPVHGWGPSGEGFVFQKAFVEFFCPRERWEHRLKPKLMLCSHTDIDWMKTDAEGLFESSETHSETHSEMYSDSTKGKPTSKHMAGQRDINVCTWGVFRNHEIITPTIIEKDSFIAWAEEAYQIWDAWAKCFPGQSEEAKCLGGLKKEMVLVNVLGHNYLGGHGGDGGQLWKVLLADD